MANTQYVTENRLLKKATNSRDKQRNAILLLGLPMAVVAGVITNPIFAAVVLILVAAGCLLVSGDAVTLAGAAGEIIALEKLCQLCDEYVIFNQVDIPSKKSRTGFNEADLVLLGPKCIFVIEVKHNNSVVVGSAKAKQWEAKKVGRGGTPYSSQMRNPIAQVKRLTWLLSEELKSRRSRMWIQGVVVFTHPSCEVQTEGELTVPVLMLNELVPYIRSYRGDAKPKAAKCALVVLRDLKQHPEHSTSAGHKVQALQRNSALSREKWADK